MDVERFGTARDGMSPLAGSAPASVQQIVETIYRDESRRIFATLIRLLGDFGVAEEALHDAFRAALEQWPRDGVPASPRAWLVSAGRFKAIDGIRRRVAEPKEQLAGFYLVEARDLNGAIQIASKIPAARVGSVEVRPVRTLPGSRSAEAASAPSRLRPARHRSAPLLRARRH